MSDSPTVFTSRTPSTAVAVHDRPSLDVELMRAKALAQAGELLPRTYRDKPGALLLIDQWAKARGIDVLTAIQTVAFIDGKPVVDATMQRALAERAGYSVVIKDATREAATVVVMRDGKHVGITTYTWEDAKSAELTGKQNWKKNPIDMLVARATTRALRWHAPSVLLGTFSEDDNLNDSPSVSVSFDPSPAPVVEQVAPVDDEVITDAEVIEDEPHASQITQADILAACRRSGRKPSEVLARSGAASLLAAVADQALAADLLAWAGEA